MISMDFLTRGDNVGGMEFIEFQTTDFYRKLSDYLEENINGLGVLSRQATKGLLEIIKDYTGFSNITVEYTDSGNLSVDTGFFSPNHVLNNTGVDELLKTTQSTLYRWFTQNTNKVFRAGIDYRTGKVSGAFCTVPVKLAINVNLHQTFPSDKIAKFGVPLQGVLAGAIAHELGHVFSGCMMLLTTASDNLLAKAAIRHYTEAKRAEDRVVVMQDVASILDLGKGKISELQELAKDEDPKTLILYFNKLVAQRNTKRALSVGVERMTSEVVADMYAIRMGCDKGIIAAISILVDHGCIVTVLSSLFTAVLLTVLVGLFTLPSLISAIAVGVPGSVLAAGGFLIFGFFFIFDYFSKGYSGVYNADHRRLEDAARQLISKLREDKRLDNAAKAEIVKEVEQLIVLTKKLKPWYESTVIHRMFGWMFSGSDFKLQEVEHYTNVLANHELNLLPTQLKLV